LAIVVIAFPIFTIGYLVTLFGIGLAFIGIARIIHGIFDKKISKWSRALLIGIDILSIVVSFMVFSKPFLGLFSFILVLTVNLLIIGIESIVLRVSGNRNLGSNLESEILK
jgi:uncharacterized membrane protein HdeD (DUF308 family)